MLKDLQTRCSTNEFNNIMSCLQSPSITDHPDFSNWTPLSGRLRCFEKLRKHLELIYPISNDEIKIESGSFMDFILNSISNNPNFTSNYNYNNKNNANDFSTTNNSNVYVSLLKLIKSENKGKKIYSVSKNKINIVDDLNKNERIYKEENEVYLRKSNSSLKQIRNEKISQSLNVNKISDIEQDNTNENPNQGDNLGNSREEFSNQLYEVYESKNKINNQNNNLQTINSSKPNDKSKKNEIYSEENLNIYNYKQNNYNENKNIISSNNSKNLSYNLQNNNINTNNYFNGSNNNIHPTHSNNNSKYNFCKNNINVIEEEERSKKDEEINLDDIDENIELDQNNQFGINKNNNMSNNQSQKLFYNSKIINNTTNREANYNINPIPHKNQKNQNNYNPLQEEGNFIVDNSIEQLDIVDDELENNQNAIDDNALSDLDKEEYFMKSCYDFFDYDITTLAERKVIEDSHPIRTSCFSSKGDYFAIGTNSKSIKLFHIKPVLQRFNKKNSYNFKSDLNIQNQIHINNNLNSKLIYNNSNNNNLNNKNNAVNNNKMSNLINQNQIENLSYNNEVDDIKMVFEQANHHMGSIYCLDWSLSGRLIASGSNDRLIKLMVVPNLDESLYGKDNETLELIITGHEGTIRTVCFEPTNDLILLSGGICNIYFFEIV